jgi:hypothetical protein
MSAFAERIQMDKNKVIARTARCDNCEKEFEAHFDADDIGGMAYETCGRCGSTLCGKCLSPARDCSICESHNMTETQI